MKKILLSLAFTLVAFSTTFAQDILPCQTDVKTQEFIDALTPQQKTQYYLDKTAYELEIQNYITNNPQIASGHVAKSGTISYTLPVVFHIIHKDGPENISEAQIKNALKHMNDDFQKLNTSANDVVSDFLPLVADAEIKFVLAQKDNSGNCTNGITRTFSSYTDGATGKQRVDAVKAIHGNWPGNKYINIFVFNTMDSPGTAGYTYRPSNYMSAIMDNGIHLVHTYVGSIGTAGSQGTHTLTHEVGHWLDLPHTWGGTNNPGLATNCNDDDGIADTPNTIGWQSCNLAGESCGSLDNVENFMEYSYCSKMFTHGQKARMHAALNIITTGRRNVHRASNLVATGVSGPGVLCEANFESDFKVICQGQTVTFGDLSYSRITSRQWNFQGGSPSTATIKSPTVTYNTPGVYEVKLTVSDGSTTMTETRSTFITVLNHGATLPVIESFEGSNSIDYSFWRVENPDSNKRFEITSDVSYTGNKAVKLENFGEAKGSIDAIASQPINLSNITSDATISFRYAYRKRDASNVESLKIFFSNTCGEEWLQRKTIKGNALGSKISTVKWTPTSQNDWVTVHMSNIPTAYWIDNFLVKFEFESDGGNNFYLDDIFIYSGTSSNEPSLGLEENGFIQSFNVYPNPASALANVTFTVENNQTVNVSLVNMMGQNIQHTSVQAESGENLVMLNTDNVEAGVYFVNINAGGVQQTKRLIIQ